MPSTKIRQNVRVGKLQLLAGASVDLTFKWQDYAIAASGVSGLAASLAVNAISTSLLMLQLSSTSSACAVTLMAPVPQNTAIAAPASGSGTVWIDWTDQAVRRGAVATWSACLYAIPTGCALTSAGASLLGSGCATMTGASANDINTGSLFQFNAPTTRNAIYSLRAIYSSRDNANTSGSEFNLMAIRLRYLADRIGS